MKQKKQTDWRLTINPYHLFVAAIVLMFSIKGAVYVVSSSVNIQVLSMILLFTLVISGLAFVLAFYLVIFQNFSKD